tara:strand:- start:662 stop:820 length:159 start_codon:yes stop_codon:yes gene_type:complete
MYSIGNTEGNMEDLEFDYVEQERSWIWAALANGTSFAMNLVVVVGVTFWMVG